MTIIILIVFIGAYSLVKVPSVQTWCVERIAHVISNNIGADVTIGSVDIKFFSKLVLNDIYIEDEKKDTLLTIQQLIADLDAFSFKEKIVDASKIDLYYANLRMKKYEGEPHANLRFILDHLKSNKPDSLKDPWDFSSDHIVLHHCSYSMIDYNFKENKKTLNFKNLDVKDINGQVNNILFEGDTIIVNLKDLALYDHSGFKLNALTTNAKIAPDKMTFSDLSVITDETNLNGHLKFSYDSLPDFKNFAENIRIDSEFSKSKISSRDLAFFVPGLAGLNKNISLSGVIRGRVTSIKGRNLDIRYSRSTRFLGNISLHGLPNLQETFIDLVVKNFYTTRNDLATVPKPPFTKKEYLKIPENVSALGNINFKGKFTGFYSDFVAYGSLTTDLGNIQSDLNLKLDKNNQPKYSGKLIADNFDFGKYFGKSEKLGRASFESTIDGSGIDLETVNASFDGILNSLEFSNYNYQNINVDGNISKGLFKGALSIKEKNLEIDFDGTIDIDRETPIYDFKADISKAKLANLNLLKRDKSANLSASADIKFSGNTLENVQGLIQLKDLVYSESGEEITVDHITLVAVDDGKQKSIDLTSDLIDASIDGTFDLSIIGKSIKQLIGNYFPLLLDGEYTVQPLQAFKFEADLKKTDKLLKIFRPGLSISDDTQIEGELNTATEELNFHLISASIVNKRFRLKDLDIQGTTKDGKLNLYSQIGGMFGNDSLFFEKGKIYANASRDSATINLKLGEGDPSDSFMDLYAVTKYLPGGGTVLTFLPSNIVKFNERWNINKANQIVFVNKKIQFNNVLFTSKTQGLQLDGALSSSTDDILNIRLKDFNMQILNNFIKMYKIRAGGIGNGSVNLAALNVKPLITANLNITDFSLFNDTLGNASIVSDYVNEEKGIRVDADISRGGSKNISLEGMYLIRKPYDMIDVEVRAKRVLLSTLQHYLATVTSDLTGIISGQAKVTGRIASPRIDGVARIQKANFLVNYLNTRYNFTSELDLVDDHILLKDVIMNDEEGSQAIVNGKVYHNNLGGLSFDVDIVSDNLKCLNTTLSQNDLYYGKAYGSGKVDITGDVKLLSMDIAMKSEKGTQINIPLSTPEEISTSSFITFINTTGEKKSLIEKKVDLSGLEMNFELEVTSDADIQLIFDEKIGDVIKGNGIGNLSMEITRAGEFNMFGEYEIQKGKYNFTLQNVIDKKFVITRGGTIRWNGDPYEAIVNIEAVYDRPTPNLKDLIPEDTLIGRIPAHVHLYITERLLNPDIKMEIKFPDLDPSVETRISRYIDSEQEINEQAFSLLILNRFSTPDEFANTVNTNTGSGVTANLTEFASNQLSAWASQLSSDLDIGVSYQPGDALTEEELEIALGTRLLNDRIILNGNFGVAGQQRTNDLVGDFIVEVLLSKDGRFRIKAFNKSNDNKLLDEFESDYTQGIGVFYRKEFNKISEVFRSYRKNKAIQDIKKKESGNKTSSSTP